MRRIENQCVDCGLPCYGCSYSHVEVRYCDECGTEGAEYVMDNDDLCEDCAEKRLNEEFNCLSVYEKAEVLGIKIYTTN